MEGNSVIRSPDCILKSKNSPGNNPFDDLWKQTIVADSSQANRRSSIGLPGDFSNIGRPSLSFRDFDGCDFANESMGILPSGFGRDSLGFMNLSSSEIGRESLGILQIYALRDSLSSRRESLDIFNLSKFRRESLESGRESLGILHIKSLDLSLIDQNKKIPDIMLTMVEENTDSLGNTLNTAFLNPQARKFSSTSSSSSVNPSFNSYSLEGPSRIYSSFSPSKSNILNIAFSNKFSNFTCTNSSIMSSIHSPFNKGRLFSPTELLISPTRIKSLPGTMEENFEPFEDKTDVKSATGRQFWSTDRPTSTKTLSSRRFHGILDFDDADSSNEFRDSVFIEGHHIAEKIADGSILNDSSGDEIGVLDCTPQPIWPEEIIEDEEQEKKDLKCDTETIFKNVDKFLPPPTLETKNFKLKIPKTDSKSLEENSGDKTDVSEKNNFQGCSRSDSKLIDNLSDITHESMKLSMSQKNQSKSKDAKEILHNLSAILNCTNRSDKQKSEGQNLLSSLADMLSDSNKKTTNLDDSGHSSIHEQSDSPCKEDHEYFEVLDLRTKTTNEDTCKESVSNENKALDLSLKPIKRITDSRLTQSFSSSIPNIRNVHIIKNKNSSASGIDKCTASNNLGNSTDSKNSNNSSRQSFAGSLKQKPISCGAKKGPMKAIIPIGDMKKKNTVAVTPERTAQEIPSLLQSNRTSTPKNKPKLKPMATSTPTEHDKKVIPASPLARPAKRASFVKDRPSTSTSLPRASPKLVRRNSVSEKRTSENVSRIVRSNSIEKESGIMSSLAKVRENIVNSSYYQLKRQSVLKESNQIVGTPVRKEKVLANKSLPNTAPKNLDSKLNPIGFPSKHQLNITKSLPTGKETIERSDIQKCKAHIKGSSVCEFKQINKLERRHSVGNELGIMSSLPKIRNNLLNSPYFQIKKENIPNENITGTLSETKKS